MRSDWKVSVTIVIIMFTCSISGCFADEGEGVSSGDLDVESEVLSSGFFNNVELSASASLSVYIPYLVIDPDLGFVQNSTVIDIRKGSSVSIDILVPPRSDGLYLLVAEYGRGHWPVRDVSELSLIHI